jgi:hypothetical protein
MYDLKTLPMKVGAKTLGISQAELIEQAIQCKIRLVGFLPNRRQINTLPGGVSRYGECCESSWVVANPTAIMQAVLLGGDLLSIPNAHRTAFLGTELDRGIKSLRIEHLRVLEEEIARTPKLRLSKSSLKKSKFINAARDVLKFHIENGNAEKFYRNNGRIHRTNLLRHMRRHWDSHELQDVKVADKRLTEWIREADREEKLPLLPSRKQAEIKNGVQNEPFLALKNCH